MPRLVAALSLLAVTACAHLFPVCDISAGEMTVRQPASGQALEVEFHFRYVVALVGRRIVVEARDRGPSECAPVLKHGASRSDLDNLTIAFKLCPVKTEAPGASWQLSGDDDANVASKLADNVRMVASGTVPFQVAVAADGHSVRVVRAGVAADIPLPVGEVGDEIRQRPQLLAAVLIVAMQWPQDGRFEVAAR
jgi:hypothetical protein